MKIMHALTAFVILFALAGCLNRPTTIPDRTIVHPTSRPFTAYIIVRREGETVERYVEFPEGSWVAYPEVLNE